MFRKSLIAFALLASCSAPPPEITAQQLADLANPPAETEHYVAQNLNQMIEKNAALEAHILANGRPLSESEVGYATRLGVAHPERVRVLVVDRISTRDPYNLELAQQEGLSLRRLTRTAGGLSTGYGILAARKFIGEDWLIAHELVHVRQFEQSSEEEMMRRLLVETHVLPGTLIPIEREAIDASDALLGRSETSYAY